MGRGGLCPRRRFVAELGGRRSTCSTRSRASGFSTSVAAKGALRRKIAERGATVLGIDNSAWRWSRRRARTASMRCWLDAADMHFDGEFDAAFSNARSTGCATRRPGGAAIFRALKAGGRFAGEMGGEGNLAKLREALDEELIIRGYVPPTAAINWYPSPEEFAARLRSRRLSRDRRAADRTANPDRAWHRRMGDDLPPRLARPRRSARRRARRHRRRRCRPLRLRRRRLCPAPLHHEEAGMIAALFMLAQITPLPEEPKPVPTTIAAIRTNPKKFDGRIVRLHGYVNACEAASCDHRRAAEDCGRRAWRQPLDREGPEIRRDRPAAPSDLCRV